MPLEGLVITAKYQKTPFETFTYSDAFKDLPAYVDILFKTNQRIQLGLGMGIAPASDFAKDLIATNALVMSGKYPDQATIAQRGPIPINFLDPYAQGAIDSLKKRVPKFYKDTHEFDGLILQDIYLPSDVPDELNLPPPPPPTPPINNLYNRRFLVTEDQIGTYEPYYFN